MDAPPPPPPPHGANPKTTAGSGGLPAGNYDIFIIPPHSSGSGFLYLPSLQVQKNSFIAGVASTLASIAVWKMIEPTVKQYFALISMSVSTGGNGVVLLVAIVGVAGWAFGQTQRPGGAFGGSGPGSGPQAGPGASSGPGGYQRSQSQPNGGFPGAGAPPPHGTPGGGWGGHQHQQHGAYPPPPQDNESWSGSQPDPSAKAEWEKAKEEERKKQEEQKRADEARKKKEEEDKRREEEQRKREADAREAQKKREEDERQAQKKREEDERQAQKKREEDERQARAKAEKEKWERMRAREREQREREARQRLAKEKLEKEKAARDKEQRDREAREAESRAKIEKEIREKLEAEQKAKDLEAARKRAEAEKAAAEAAAIKAKAEAEAAAAKVKADADRAERLKAARERAAKEREAREARLKAEADKIKASQAASSVDPSAGRRSTTYGGGGGERLDPYAGARSPPAPSVTSTHSSPIKVTISPKKQQPNYEKPSAKSYIGTEDAHSFRPYDTPKRPPKPPSHYSSVYSESSYAPSQSTSRTTPPASQRGPYSTADPDKIQIKAVYLFNDLFPKPVAQLVAGIGAVTDGLILKITTEGLFIDDDVRHVAQREWDIKAWTLKLIETGERSGQHILRACIRDTDGKKYVFIIDQSESWKVAIGLQRLRKGALVRSMANGQIAAGEINRILNTVPPIPT